MAGNVLQESLGLQAAAPRVPCVDQRVQEDHFRDVRRVASDCLGPVSQESRDAFAFFGLDLPQCLPYVGHVGDCDREGDGSALYECAHCFANRVFARTYRWAHSVFLEQGITPGGAV